MIRSILYFFIVMLLLQGSLCFALEPLINTTFLIQDVWGGIIGITLSPDGTPSEPGIVRPMTSEFPKFLGLEAFTDGAYQLMSNGYVLPIGNTKLPLFFWMPTRDPKDFTMLPGNQGGWLSAGKIIKKVGRYPPNLVLPPINRAINDLEYDPLRNRLILLFEDGEIAISTESAFQMISTLELTEDTGIQITFNPKQSNEFYVLTENAKVYHVTPDQAVLFPDIPSGLEGLARDIEYSLTGTGFYLLDGFGTIHACGGAQRVPTEPFTNNIAIDLEIIASGNIPQWYPTGWNTKVQLVPQTLSLDPGGYAKTMSVVIQEAENLSWFSTELRYDPALVTIPLEGIRNGEWWERVMNGSQVAASVEPKSGLIQLKGGSVFSPFEGPSGNGELVRLEVKTANPVSIATTTIDINHFYFADASPLNQYSTAEIVHSATIIIRPSRPRLFVQWSREGKEITNSPVKPGDVIRVELMVEDGSRIHEIVYGFRFQRDMMKFLGMVNGSAWKSEIPVWSEFDLPSQANQEEGLSMQTIRASTSRACTDKPGSLVILFFAVTGQGQGTITFDSIEIRNEEGNVMELKNDVSDISILSQ